MKKLLLCLLLTIIHSFYSFASSNLVATKKELTTILITIDLSKTRTSEIGACPKADQEDKKICDVLGIPWPEEKGAILSHILPPCAKEFDAQGKEITTSYKQASWSIFSGVELYYPFGTPELLFPTRLPHDFIHKLMETGTVQHQTDRATIEFKLNESSKRTFQMSQKELSRKNELELSNPITQYTTQNNSFSLKKAVTLCILASGLVGMVWWWFNHENIHEFFIMNPL